MQASGYFFVINEAVYPIYTAPRYTDNLTIEESWFHLCNSLLNGAYGRTFNDLLEFIPRGTVHDDGTVECTNISDYTLRIVKDLFRLPESFPIKEGNKCQSSPSENQATKLRNLYLPINYLYTLPWHALQSLASAATPEGKEVLNHMWRSRGVLVRKRLGALKSLPQLQ